MKKLKLSQMTWGQARRRGYTRKQWLRAKKISIAIKQWWKKRKKLITTKKAKKNYVAYLVWLAGKGYRYRWELRVYFPAYEDEAERIGREYMDQALRQLKYGSLDHVLKMWRGAVYYVSLAESGLWQEGEIKPYFTLLHSKRLSKSRMRKIKEGLL